MEMILFSDLSTVFYGFLFGCIIGLVYDFFRVFRLVFHTGTGLLFFEDFIFSVFLAGSVFAFCFLFNIGKIRFFYLTASRFGGILYYFTVGRLAYRGMKALFRTGRRFLHRETRKQKKTKTN